MILEDNKTNKKKKPPLRTLKPTQKTLAVRWLNRYQLLNPYPLNLDFYNQNQKNQLLKKLHKRSQFQSRQKITPLQM